MIKAVVIVSLIIVIAKISYNDEIPRHELLDRIDDIREIINKEKE